MLNTTERNELRKELMHGLDEKIAATIKGEDATKLIKDIDNAITEIVDAHQYIGNGIPEDFTVSIDHINHQARRLVILTDEIKDRQTT